MENSKWKIEIKNVKISVCVAFYMNNLKNILKFYHCHFEFYIFNLLTRRVL